MECFDNAQSTISRIEVSLQIIAHCWVSSGCDSASGDSLIKSEAHSMPDYLRSLTSHRIHCYPFPDGIDGFLSHGSDGAINNLSKSRQHGYWNSEIIPFRCYYKRKMPI